MAYENTIRGSDVRETDFGSIQNRLDQFVSNFSDISARLQNSTDSLFGPTSKASTGASNAPAAVPNGYIDAIQMKLIQIDDLRCAINNSLERLERAV